MSNAEKHCLLRSHHTPYEPYMPVASRENKEKWLAMKRHRVRKVSTCHMEKDSQPTAFCARDSNAHLPVTPARLRGAVLAETHPA